jgi:glycosyltransferase involved in cell wall biosynthesis
MPANSDPKLIRVFVQLSVYFGATHWRRWYAAGALGGINDPLPYGYYRASEDGCLVVYSEDKDENRLQRAFRLGMKFLVGADIVHAWRNRRGIYESEIVWTHTELQYIAVLLLFRFLFWKRRPKLIAQSVWLFDRWESFSSIKRWFLSQLIRKADILTVLSPENLVIARQLFPCIRSELVLFGINTDTVVPVKKDKPHQPLHIFSIGNDPDRDWPVLIQAIRGTSGCELKIASWNFDKRLMGPHDNIEILRIKSNSALFEAYDWADIVVVTIKNNRHASGITVLQEATIRGLPVICTDTGGLRAYFSESEICFVPLGDPSGLQKAIATLAGDDPLRWGLAERAQARMTAGGLNSRAYARRHAELSRELLAPDVSRAAKN